MDPTSCVKSYRFVETLRRSEALPVLVSARPRRMFSVKFLTGVSVDSGVGWNDARRGSGRGRHLVVGIHAEPGSEEIPMIR
jgi:hypothetical protein